MDKILDNEITNSVKNEVKKRLSSSIYGTFVIFWLVCHWRFVLTIFFVSEDLILKQTGLLKNDYLLFNYFDVGSLYFWSSWSLPFLFTYAAIWMLPKYVLIPAFKKEAQDQTIKKVFELNEEKLVIVAQTNLEKENAKQVTEVAKQVVQEKKIRDTNPKIEWDADYINFSKNGYANIFLNFLNKFYSGDRYLHYFSPNDVSYFDALGLIKIDKNSVDTLSDKGKYFALKIKDKESF
ncbi:MAG: hypothetical protein WC027_02000 [Candidatus Paceibacterota bacterium]